MPIVSIDHIRPKRHKQYCHKIQQLVPPDWFYPPVLHKAPKWIQHVLVSIVIRFMFHAAWPAPVLTTLWAANMWTTFLFLRFQVTPRTLSKIRPQPIEARSFILTPALMPWISTLEAQSLPTLAQGFVLATAERFSDYSVALGSHTPFQVWIFANFYLLKFLVE